MSEPTSAVIEQFRAASGKVVESYLTMRYTAELRAQFDESVDLPPAGAQVLLVWFEPPAPKPAMRATDWTCGRCAESGLVEHKADANVYEVIHLIKDAHEKQTAMPSHFDIARFAITLHSSDDSKGAADA